MTISAQIRALALEGLETADIAKRLGIRYQHAYNVLKRSKPSIDPLPAEGDRVAIEMTSARKSPTMAGKPPLPVEALTDGGFQLAGRWILSSDGDLVLETPMPRDVGVYAFVKAGIAQYVGVATMGMSKRLYFYGRPGISQRTSQRLNAILKAELQGPDAIEIYVASPPDLEWNGLPVHGSAGLELGIIKKYALPWNMRSAR